MILTRMLDTCSQLLNSKNRDNLIFIQIITIISKDRLTIKEKYFHFKHKAIFIELDTQQQIKFIFLLWFCDMQLKNLKKCVT